MKFFLIGAAGFFLFLFIGGCGTIMLHNGLITSEENVEGQWAEVENMLKRRADLIPNLVETVKGYAKHEKEIFTAVAEARSKMMGAKGVKEKAAAAGTMNSALSRLLMVSERYPDLKANQNFMRLQDEVTGTENRIAVARSRYNESVKTFNAKIRKFPHSMIAGFKGMEKKEYFEITNPKDKEVPKVKF
jgi:LemA protein